MQVEPRQRGFDSRHPAHMRGHQGRAEHGRRVDARAYLRHPHADRTEAAQQLASRLKAVAYHRRAPALTATQGEVRQERVEFALHILSNQAPRILA